MPLEKLSGPPQLCRDADHHPVDHRTLEPGKYRHWCPACRQETIFRVPERAYQAAQPRRSYCELETMMEGVRVACAREPGHSGDCDFLRGVE